MATISRAEKSTAKMGIYTMRKLHIGKSANILAFKHVIVRYAIKGGAKRAMNVSGRKGG
jgi:hypothetical protein